MRFHHWFLAFLAVCRQNLQATPGAGRPPRRPRPRGPAPPDECVCLHGSRLDVSDLCVCDRESKLNTSHRSDLVDDWLFQIFVVHCRCSDWLLLTVRFGLCGHIGFSICNGRPPRPRRYSDATATGSDLKRVRALRFLGYNNPLLKCDHVPQL